MLAELTAACELLGDVLSALQPGVLSGVECARVVETLSVAEKRCAGVRALAALRASECQAHKERGFSDPATWLAHCSGVTVGDANAALATAACLDACDATREAVLAGQVSMAQAGEITKAERAVPGSEAELLDLAARSSVGGLRDAARKRRLEAQDDQERHRRQRQSRYFRHWQDDQGMIRISGAFTPEVGVALCNRVDAMTDRLWRDAQRDAKGVSTSDRGGPSGEARECVAADALARLVVGGEGAHSGRSADLVLVCDAAAFYRGHTHRGETCHVVSAGPVPVAVAWELAVDAFIKAVLHDGTDITTIAHFGRHINAKLRTALNLGDPPLFDGARCAEDGCDRRYHLEWDHANPVANSGMTSLENLEPRCHPCHQEKTRRDREAGLLGNHQWAAANRSDQPVGVDHLSRC
jgi:hypothetical protein